MDKRQSLIDVDALAGMGQASAALLAQLARPPAADRFRLGREAEVNARDQSTHVALDQAVSEQILSSSLPSGSGLEQAQPIKLADTMPESLRRLLLRSNDEPRPGHTPGLFKACGCGKTKQHGGPCIFRAWVRVDTASVPAATATRLQSENTEEGMAPEGSARKTKVRKRSHEAGHSGAAPVTQQEGEGGRGRGRARGRGAGTRRKGRGARGR